MGNKLVGRHGLHIYPFEPAEMILDPQSFFKQTTKFDRTQVDVPQPTRVTIARSIEYRAARGWTA